MQIEIIQDLEVRPYFGPVPHYLDDVRRATMFQLVIPFIVEIDGERHQVEEGFIFNGSSVPRPLWWRYPPTFRPAFRGSALHDKGVGFAWKNKPQAYWDEVFKHMILLDGGTRLEAGVFHWAVGLQNRGAYR